MFKKRVINSKPIQSVQVNEQVKINNKHRQANESFKKEEEMISQSNQQHLKQSNRMQEKQFQNEDEQFVQRLKKDKKIDDLFANFIDSEQKDQQSPKNKYLQKNQQASSQSIKITPYLKKKINFTFTKSEKTQKPLLEQEKSAKPKQIKVKQTKKQTEIEMQDIFRQIRQQNKQQEQKEVQTYKEQNQNNQSVNISKPIIANQFIIQDEDGFVQQISKQQFAYPVTSVQEHGSLKVAVDYQGNVSPQLSQNDDEMEEFHHQDDFQDQLIRKTLTRNNYLKLQQTNNLKHTKFSQKKQKLFNIILKTSWNDIQNKLSSDINEKVTKKNELQQEMKYLQERVSEKTNQIDRKKVMLRQLSNQQKKLKKVIYFLCYFGDQICGKNESIDTFFSDLTPNIIDKIEKISDRINIEEFMQKTRSRQELKQQYQKGRKKIKGNEKLDAEQINEEQNEEDDEDEDGQFFMQDDGF